MKLEISQIGGVGVSGCGCVGLGVGQFRCRFCVELVRSVTFGGGN